MKSGREKLYMAAIIVPADKVRIQHIIQDSSRGIPTNRAPMVPPRFGMDWLAIGIVIGKNRLQVV